jgi:uncharacterized membrane protein
MHISDYRWWRQKMSEKTKEIYNKKESFFNRLLIGFIFGVGAVMSIWFLSGLLYVIFK